MAGAWTLDSGGGQRSEKSGTGQKVGVAGGAAGESGGSGGGVPGIRGIRRGGGV